MIRHRRLTAALAAAACVAASTGAIAQPAERTADEQKALEIYRTIIGFRSAAGHGQTPEVAAYLASELKAAGFGQEDIEIIPPAKQRRCLCAIAATVPQ